MAQPTIAPARDFARNMHRCLSDAGWTVEIDSDGAVTASVPSNQQESYDAAFQACESEFGYNLPLPAMDADEARRYLARLGATAQCLRDAGYSVPTAPSEQVSLDGLMTTARDAQWDVYGDIPDGRELVDAQARCPIT